MAAGKARRVIRLERVIDALPAGFDALRGEARADGHGMLDTLAVEWTSGATGARTSSFADAVLANDRRKSPIHCLVPVCRAVLGSCR